MVKGEGWLLYFDWFYGMQIIWNYIFSVSPESEMLHVEIYVQHRKILELTESSSSFGPV